MPSWTTRSIRIPRRLSATCVEWIIPPRDTTSPMGKMIFKSSLASVGPGTQGRKRTSTQCDAPRTSNVATPWLSRDDAGRAGVRAAREDIEFGREGSGALREIGKQVRIPAEGSENGLPELGPSRQLGDRGDDPAEQLRIGDGVYLCDGARWMQMVRRWNIIGGRRRMGQDRCRTDGRTAIACPQLPVPLVQFRWRL
ncbi:hypothetical protein C8F01DRAFT_1173739, partial [Mycena amicta]